LFEHGFLHQVQQDDHNSRPGLTISPPRYKDMQPVPSTLQFVQMTTRPSAGLAIAFRSAKVMRGARKPFDEDLTSSIAELPGALPSVLIATWEKALCPANSNIANKATILFMVNKIIVNN
jgi:hypothetical protein